MKRWKNTLIAIPSRRRAYMIADTLPKTIENLSDEDVESVTVFVEESDVLEYSEHTDQHGVKIQPLDAEGQGLGYARRFIQEYARDNAYDYVVHADDDKILPDNIKWLALALEKHDLPGCGAWHRILSHFCGVTQHTGVHADTGSMGCSVFAVDVEAEGLVGGFDPVHRAGWEDYDLILKCIREGLGPWGIHSGVEVRPIGRRYQEGGIASLGDVKEIEKRSAQALHQKHPEYVTVLKNGRARVQWKRAYLDAGFDWPLTIGHEYEEPKPTGGFKD